MQATSNSNNRDYLGTGFAFPLGVNAQGLMRLSSEDVNIEEAIRIILRTEPGERVYRPDFGCNLSELAFAPLNTRTLMSIRLCVQDALYRWEPRIEKIQVDTDPDPIRGRVDITISYRIKNTYDVQSVVYPFYLSASQE
jgi:phage baseplate assembly protein W